MTRVNATVIIGRSQNDGLWQRTQPTGVCLKAGKSVWLMATWGQQRQRSQVPRTAKRLQIVVYSCSRVKEAFLYASIHRYSYSHPSLAKVGNLQDSPCADEEVGRLDVSVKKALNAMHRQGRINARLVYCKGPVVNHKTHAETPRVSDGRILLYAHRYEAS